MWPISEWCNDHSFQRSIFRNFVHWWLPFGFLYKLAFKDSFLLFMLRCQLFLWMKLSFFNVLKVFIVVKLCWFFCGVEGVLSCEVVKIFCGVKGIILVNFIDFFVASKMFITIWFVDFFCCIEWIVELCSFHYHFPFLLSLVHFLFICIWFFSLLCLLVLLIVLLFVTLWVSMICNYLTFFQVSCECLHGQWLIYFFLVVDDHLRNTYAHFQKETKKHHSLLLL